MSTRYGKLFTTKRLPNIIRRRNQYIREQLSTIEDIYWSKTRELRSLDVLTTE